MAASNKGSRAEAVFGWLRDHGSSTWPGEFLALCDGLRLSPPAVAANGAGHGRGRRKRVAAPSLAPGGAAAVHFADDCKVKASTARLAWMLRNAERLAPADPSRWKRYRKSVIDNPEREAAVELLELEQRKGVPKKLILEGAARPDCLIDCEHLIVWIEGFSEDWAAPSSKWDLSRDQIARNTEAVWQLARQAGKECCLVVCHNYPLRHHEQALIEGYRTGSWSAGWPHLDAAIRRDLGARIGTVTWGRILAHWPELGELEELAHVSAAAPC